MNKAIHPKFSEEQMKRLRDAMEMIGCRTQTAFCEIATMEKVNRVLNENKMESIMGKLKKGLYEPWES